MCWNEGTAPVWNGPNTGSLAPRVRWRVKKKEKKSALVNLKNCAQLPFLSLLSITFPRKNSYQKFTIFLQHNIFLDYCNSLTEIVITNRLRCTINIRV